MMTNKTFKIYLILILIFILINFVKRKYIIKSFISYVIEIMIPPH